MFLRCFHDFLYFLKYLGITKCINTWLQGFENPEILRMSSFAVQNNEIGILLDQSEAEKYRKLLNLFSIRLLYISPKNDNNYYNMFPMGFL